MKLIRTLYSEKDAELLEDLWQTEQDSMTRLAIANQVGVKLKKQGIVNSSADEQLMVLMSTANFASSSDECVYVAGCLKYGLSQKEILPSFYSQENRELAPKCLISLSLFYGALKHRSDRHGAPKPHWYREQGVNAFNQLGREDVADHFQRWEGFISENFV